MQKAVGLSAGIEAKVQQKLAGSYEAGGKTSGIFKGGGITVELQSGYDGPAANMPEESSGFDGYTLSHVEGHAAALMRQMGITEGTLTINNPDICRSCMKNLPTMLRPAVPCTFCFQMGES